MNEYKLRLALTMLLLIPAWSAVADVPGPISYQGHLTDESGDPVQDGVYAIAFTIYDVPAGGAELWCSGTRPVTVRSGLFSYALGSSNPFPATLFDDGALWLGITLPPNEEMVPRIKLGSNPYAVVTGRVIGDIETSPGQVRIEEYPYDWVEIDPGGIRFPEDTGCYVVPPCGGWSVKNIEYVNYDCNSDFASAQAYTSDPDGSRMHAELHLPQGVTIIRLEATVFDNRAQEDLVFTLFEITDQGGSPGHTELASLSSSGSVPEWQTIHTDLSHNISDICDNDYVVRLDIPRHIDEPYLEWSLVRVYYTTESLFFRRN